MHPHKEIIHVDVSEHGVGAVVHLGVCPSSNNIVLARGVLCQVEVGKKLVLLAGGELEDISSRSQSPFSAIASRETKLALPAAESHEVAFAFTRPVVKYGGPVLSVIHPRERELWSQRSLREKDVLAGPSSGKLPTRGPVSIPGGTALLPQQARRVRTGSGELPRGWLKDD